MVENYFTNKKIQNDKVSLGFFTRKGGYSVKNFFSLNCGYNSKDIRKNITKNIETAKNKIGFKNKQLITVNQIHSNKVILVNKGDNIKKINADGIISINKEICIAVLTADCCPIFIFDDESNFISCLHAGWKGCFNNIVNVALNKINKIQKNKKKINVIIGPCLNKKNFEVSNNFKINFIKKNINYKNFFFEKNNNRIFFDMRGLIKHQFLINDVHNIENINKDTYDNEQLFYSHRRSTHLKQSQTGRMINIIGFNK